MGVRGETPVRKIVHLSFLRVYCVFISSSETSSSRTTISLNESSSELEFCLVAKQLTLEVAPTVNANNSEINFCVLIVGYICIVFFEYNQIKNTCEIFLLSR